MILKLKSPTIHAIRILKYMGEKGEPLPVSADICKDVNVTQSYFMRISRDLRRARLLETTQGRMGGFYLNRSLDEISLYDVVVAMQGGEDQIEGAELKELGQIMGNLNEQVAENLKAVSLKTL